MKARHGVLGSRRLVLLAIAVAGLWAAFELKLAPGDLIPSRGGLGMAGRFFSGAVSPAMTYEADFVPEGTSPLLVKTMAAALRTVGFAAAAISLSLVFGLLLGFFASCACWAGEPAGGANPTIKLMRRTGAHAAHGFARVLIALSRSIHELLWAVLFLCAMGLTNLTAVLAIAIPYSGTFAKIFSEMIDEAPRDSAMAMRAAGASPAQTFIFGRLPRAMPDMAAYTLYRFECALRSAAVLGFFGIATLGYYIELSFQNAHYREVWTYLYAMFILVIVFDWWSGAIRRRMVS